MLRQASVWKRTILIDRTYYLAFYIYFKYILDIKVKLKFYFRMPKLLKSRPERDSPLAPSDHEEDGSNSVQDQELAHQIEEAMEDTESIETQAGQEEEEGVRRILHTLSEMHAWIRRKVLSGRIL